jgi:hypothetical protein
MTHLKTLAVGVTLAIASLGALAQAEPAASTPRVDKRQAVQDKRIETGLAAGTLTEREAARMENQQEIRTKAEDKAKADGTVTKRERLRLNKMERRSSRHIAVQKHDKQASQP